MHRGPRRSLNPQNPEGEFSLNWVHLHFTLPVRWHRGLASSAMFFIHRLVILIAPRKGPIACIKWGRISHDSKQPLFISLSTSFSFCNSIGAK
ncbi:hypothetical protein DTO169C6_2774 [Paecilomyces variotii]|nr:hypothetical protein DTO169C6_2774 [Paecilomyces variotii]